MHAAFLRSEYYEPSAPYQRLQLTVSLPAATLAEWREGRPWQGSHVHCVSVDRIGAQLCRYSLAITEPAATR